MTNPVTPEHTPNGSSAQPTPYGSPATNPYAAPAGSEKRPILSILSLASAFLSLIIGVTGFGIVFAIAAVVLGHLGRKREPHGRTFWITGLVLGYLGIAFNVALIVVILVLGGGLFALLALMF
jgi:hypothetical protein